jgi:hypothetical protein
MRTPDLYNETHQSRATAPTAYENLLGDAIERAFGQGIHDLDGLVSFLNRSGVSAPNGQPWTTAVYETEMARLGA